MHRRPTVLIVSAALGTALLFGLILIIAPFATGVDEMRLAARGPAMIDMRKQGAVPAPLATVCGFLNAPCARLPFYGSPENDAQAMIFNRLVSNRDEVFIAGRTEGALQHDLDGWLHRPHPARRTVW